MLNMCRLIFGSWKVVVLDIEFSVVKGITELEAKGIYVASLINNRRYWHKWVPGDLIDTHFEYKEVSGVGNKFFNMFFYEWSGLCDEDICELDETWWVRRRKETKISHRQQREEGYKKVHIPADIWASFLIQTSSWQPQ